MLSQIQSRVTVAALPAGPVPVDFEVVLHGPLGVALAECGGDVVVGVEQVCAALVIDAGPELERLAAARWAGLTSVVAPETGETVVVLPWPAARLWLLGLDARRVAPRSKRWLEDLQADAVEMLRDLPD